MSSRTLACSQLEVWKLVNFGVHMQDRKILDDMIEIFQTKWHVSQTPQHRNSLSLRKLNTYTLPPRFVLDLENPIKSAVNKKHLIQCYKALHLCFLKDSKTYQTPFPLQANIHFSLTQVSWNAHRYFAQHNRRQIKTFAKSRTACSAKKYEKEIKILQFSITSWYQTPAPNRRPPQKVFKPRRPTAINQ